MEPRNKKRNKVSPRVSVHIRILHRDFGWTVLRIFRDKYPHIPRTTITHHAKKTIEGWKDKRKSNPGRPRKLSLADIRFLKRKIVQLRDNEDVNFSAVELQNVCGFENMSTKTIHRALRKNNLFYLNTRQKGILTAADRKKRVNFCKRCVSMVGDRLSELWSKSISFYYDGVNFYHKSNPFSDAVSPKSKVWRNRSEGLKITRKGKKEGNNGRKLRLFVAVSYGKGVIMCDEFPRDLKFNGANYKEFVINTFPEAFKKCCNSQKLVLQDGDPVQKSKQAQTAYDVLNCTIFDIPPRSPDLNPIENVFHNVRREMRNDVRTRRIEKETFDEFALRVIATIKRTPVDLVDRTIDSLPRRMKMVITSKGDRIKY